jgi:transcriptional regulator with XRE-family HTH domain
MQKTINPVNAYIGARLRQARLMRDLSQKELGQRIKKTDQFPASAKV